MSTNLKPSDVQPGMKFRDRDLRGSRSTLFTVTVVSGRNEPDGYAVCKGIRTTRIRLDRLTNPRLYERMHLSVQPLGG